MFEANFLVDRNEYQRVIQSAAEIVAQSLPSQPYAGARPGVLAELVPSEFLPRSAASFDQIAETLRLVVANSISLVHPRTAAHLHPPPLVAGLAAEVIIGALNQSMDSFDQGPISTVVEQKMVRWLCGEVRFPASASGTFTTGGSQSNYMGLMLARDAFQKKHWDWSGQKSGLHAEARHLRIFCSEVSHFTVEKSASQLGLGTDAVVRVAVDDNFRMVPAALQNAVDKARDENLFPLAVVATAGTTDFGSIDPLMELAMIAHSAGAWLHVDAAYGGALLFSEIHRRRLHGLDAADSVSLDFHKLFWQPIPCSIFLVRDAGHFDSMKLHADYLNPEGHEEDGIPDLVTTSLLTTRRFDTLKLWISLLSIGRRQLSAMIDRTLELANHAAQTIKHTAHLELLAPVQLSTVVFRYVPGRAGSNGEAINEGLRQRLFERGIAVIGHTRVHDRQCLKFTCMNPTASVETMDDLIEQIAQEGAALESEGL